MRVNAFSSEEIEVMRIFTTAALTLEVWIIRNLRGSCGPPDYNIVPRYCYDNRDDRVETSPHAKPVAPVHGLEYGGPGGW